MSVFHRLSRFVFIPCLIEWLEVEDFLAFDSAVCNVEDRSQLSHMLMSYSKNFQDFIFSTQESVSLTVSLFHWMTQRLENFKQVNESITLRVTNASLTKFRYNRDKSAKERLFTFCSMVKSVYFGKCSNDNFRYLINNFIPHCNSLREVEFRDDYVSASTNKMMPSIAAQCYNSLRVLNLNKCYSISQDTMVDVIQICTQLTHLYVMNCKKFSSNFMKALVVHARQLNDLVISNCRKISNRDIQMWALHCAKILNSYSHPLHIDNINTVLAYRGKQLKELELQSCCTSASECHHLASIDLWCSSLQSLYVYEVGAHAVDEDFLFENLISLHLEGIYAQLLRRILKETFTKCTNLHTLHCKEDYNINSNTQNVVEMTDFNCTQLRSLTLFGIIHQTDWFGILSQSIYLESLHCSPSIALETVMNLEHIFQNLTELECLSNAYPCMEHIVKCSSNLKYLQLQIYSTKLRNNLIAYGQNITCLDISRAYCHYRDVNYLINSLHSLKKIHVSEHIDKKSIRNRKVVQVVSLK